MENVFHDLCKVVCMVQKKTMSVKICNLHYTLNKKLTPYECEILPMEHIVVMKIYNV